MQEYINQVKIGRIDRVVGEDGALLSEKFYDINNNLIESHIYEYGNNGLRSIVFLDGNDRKFAVNKYDEDKTTYVSYEGGRKTLEVVYDKNGRELSREEE